MTTNTPIRDYLRCPTAVLALPNTTYRIGFRHLMCTEKAIFYRKQPYMIIPSSLSRDFHKQALSQKKPHINQKEKITGIPLTSVPLYQYNIIPAIPAKMIIKIGCTLNFQVRMKAAPKIKKLL